MPPPGGRAIPIAQSIVDRAAGVVAGAIRGAAEAWFGPQQPIAPQAPASEKGRAFDYQAGHNLSWKPRAEQGETSIGYQTLRDLAEPTRGGFDLLRLAIETRKDQMAAQQWVIAPRLEDGEEPTDAQKARAKEIGRALRKPDEIHTLAQWQRMLLEELLVTDAPTVYYAPSAKGYRIPEIVDGALIRPLIRGDGRRPLPPDPAYVQQLKGLPATHYSLDELTWMPRNLRSHRLYGMSPTEQVISTVNIALRRQLSQLEFYTAGSVPDLLLGVPESWAPDQIKTVQEWFDSVLSGNTEERRRARFIPGGVKPFPLKEGALKDAWDEWLARIVCYAFSLSPQALVPQMNRATAETAEEQARDEGLEPLKLWWADFVGEVLAKAFPDGAEFQLAYADEEIGDAKTKAEVFSLAVGKWLLPDEARRSYGKPPLTDEQRAELAAMQPAGAPTLGGAVAEGDPAAEPTAEGDAPVVAGAEVVQDTALNGAQVSSLLEIVQAVAGGEIPIESARGIVAAAFPMLSPEQVEKIIGSLQSFEQKTPEPVPPNGAPSPMPPQGKGEPEDEEDDDTEKLARALVGEMQRARIFVPARVKPAQLGLFPPGAPKA